MPQTVVGHAHYGRPLDPGNQQENPLDLGGVHVGAAAQDEGIASVGDEEPTGVVEEPDVPGHERAVAQCIRRGFFVAQVPEHGTGRARPTDRNRLPGR